jgi:hypothetical protein
MIMVISNPYPGKAAPRPSQAAALLSSTPLADDSAFVAMEPNATPSLTGGCYRSLQAFLDTEILEPEEILCGLHRGEVAALVADDAQAKTTLLLNLGLTLAAGISDAPFLPDGERARRVVYLSGDAAPARLHRQLHSLTSQLGNPEIAQTNFVPLIDLRVDNVRLNLSCGAHWQAVSAFLSEQRPDVILVDAARFTTLEGAGLKVTKQFLMSQWKQLAEQLDCAVIIAQTTGKANRLRQTAIANLSDSADTLYHLSSDARRGSDYRLLSCEQSRWEVPQAVSLQLDEAENGFHIVPPEEVAESSKSQMPTVAELVAFVEGKKYAYPEHIVQHFEERASPSKVARLIREAELLGWIMRRHRDQPWQLDKRGLQAKAAREAAQKNGTDVNRGEGGGESGSEGEGMNG